MKKLSVRHGKTVVLYDENRERHEYRGSDFLLRGRNYRIGMLNPAEFTPSEIAKAIDESGVRSFDA